MNSALETRLKSYSHPFDGVTVYCPKHIPVSRLHEVLAAISQYLQIVFPLGSVVRLLDWYEHDGYISEASPCAWSDLDNSIASEKTLCNAFHLADSEVRIGFTTTAYDFYLRFYVWAEEASGDFDLTCSEALARILVSKLARCCDAELISVQSPKAFFTERAA